MPKNKSSPGEKADFFAFPSRFTILGQVRKNTIPIYLPTKRPRIGTIMKNHIQSSSGLSKAALFVCSESDTSLKNYIIYTISMLVQMYLISPFICIIRNSYTIYKKVSRTFFRFRRPFLHLLIFFFFPYRKYRSRT